MEDDTLLEKLFNYICGSGGFVELSVLLRRSSPLGSRKSAREAKDWLKNQSKFALVKDGNGEVTGVRIDFKKKLCQQYVWKGSCRNEAFGFCKYWHICKKFIEGKCVEVGCRLSHDFREGANKEMVKKLGLEKYSSGALKNIVSWSLPQVCESYLMGKCKSDECTYIHVCSKAIYGLSCSCSLSHSLTDSHNVTVLKQYDLVPSTQVVNVGFARCNVLFPWKERYLASIPATEDVVSGTTAKATGFASQIETPSAEKTTSAVAKKSAAETCRDRSKLGTPTTVVGTPLTKNSVNTAATSKSTTENTVRSKTSEPAVFTQTTKATATASASDAYLNSRFKISGASIVLFRRLCKEFNCTAPLIVLQNRKVVLSNELEDFMKILEENRDKFLVSRNERGIIHRVSAFCPKLRLCASYVSLNGCKKQDCPYFHLCRKFVIGSCQHGEKCSRIHSFRNKRDRKALVQLDLDGLTNGQLRHLMVASSPQVCIDYNEGTCISGSFCSRVHICREYVTNTCTKEARCLLYHNQALQTQHTRSLLEKYMVNSTGRDALKAILVYEGKDYCNPRTELATTVSLDQEIAEGHSADTVKSKVSAGLAVSSKTAEGNSIERKTTVTTAVTSTAVTGNDHARTAAGPKIMTSKIAGADTARGQISTANATTTETPVTDTTSSKTVTASGVAKLTTVANSNVNTPANSAATARRRSSLSNLESLEVSRVRFTPSRKAIFECICRDYDGSVSFTTMSERHDLFPDYSGDIATWFRRHREGFHLTEDTDGSILNVSVFCRGARLCFDYLFSPEDCSRDDCPFFHVCREYIAGLCGFGSRCKWHHNFQYDEKRKLVGKLELDGLTHEELRKVLRLSMPQVCSDYNDSCCNGGLSCSRVHICKNFVKRMCDDEENCELQHKNALLTSHSSAILEKYDLRYKDGNFNFLLKMLLVCDDSSRGSRERKNSSISQLSDSLKWKMSASLDHLPGESEHQTSSRSEDSDYWNYSAPLPNRNEGSLNMKRLESSKRTPCFPRERQLFQTLCTEYDCSSSFTAIAKRTDLFPHGIDSAESWFRRTKGSFLITESDTEKGKISRVEAFSRDARLCLDYIEKRSCHKRDCQNFHVCKGYITDSCSLGAACPMNHHFRNKKDEALLSRIRLDLLTEQQLRTLVLLSSPQVCVEYNNSICERGNSCLKIHMCCGYLRNCCAETWRCGLKHEGAFDTKQTQTILQRLQMNSLNTKDTLKLVFDDKRCFSGKDKTKCHIHVDRPDAPICSSFLIGDCALGITCLKHHCSLPYHWQYKVPNVDAWNSFGQKDNATLEKLYCDVNVDTRVYFEPFEALDFSLAESKRVVSLVQGYTVTIDLDDKLMFLRPQISHDILISPLRRLSTVDCVSNPCTLMAKSWIWHWEENGNGWRRYEVDRSGRQLQRLIEQGYQDYLKHGKVREKFRFATTEHEYNLFFYPTEMYQVNLKTGTKRRVKRRPGKFISSEDMEDLKWRYGDSSIREAVRRSLAKNKYFPSHWSSMPPNVKYYRATVDQCSAEFTDVEQLFRRTMNDYVKIICIDRVQNLSMMEKYCRKKENMLAASKRTQQEINEKRLFHGTSSDAVEAICKHNFDWRLHGKNATELGEGSYFAKNAFYSHAFATKDAFGYHQMFLAKVLAGSYTKGHSSYRRPPPKNPSDPASDLYDSCVDNQSNPSVFVVFDTDQLYPEYIIRYSTASHFTSASAYHVLPQASVTYSASASSTAYSPEKVNVLSTDIGSTTGLPRLEKMKEKCLIS